MEASTARILLERGRMALCEAGRPDLAALLFIDDETGRVQFPPDVDDLNVMHRASTLVRMSMALPPICTDCFGVLRDWPCDHSDVAS
jgi:hypothetical protein